MQVRKNILKAQAIVTAASVAAVLLCAAGAPVLADQRDYKGWFVALDLANAQPTGLDQHYATLIDQATGFQTTAIMDNDADLTYRAAAGYSWGALGGLGVSYWSFDNEDKLNASDSVNAVYATVFGGYTYNAFGYPLLPGAGPVVYETTSQVKASIIDLDYVRPMAVGEKTTIKWLAGLRSASWEETEHFSGSDGYGYYIIQDKSVESDAFGVKVGATIDFGFTEHFSLQGTMNFSFLQADNEMLTTQNFLGVTDQVTTSDDNVRGEIRDFDVRGAWSWDHFGFWIGYGGQTWDGLVADPAGDPSCCGATRVEHSTRDSIAFNMMHTGVIFRFGGGK